MDLPIRVLSNDQTNFPKTCYFGKKKLATLSKETTKLSNAKHCTFGKFLEIFAKFLLMTPSDFINPSQQQQQKGANGTSTLSVE